MWSSRVDKHLRVGTRVCNGERLSHRSLSSGFLLSISLIAPTFILNKKCGFIIPPPCPFGCCPYIWSLSSVRDITQALNERKEKIKNKEGEEHNLPGN